MSFSRREFLQLSLKSLVVIGAGSSLSSFATKSFSLPAKDKLRLRFALASDGHYGQPNTQYRDLHDQMVEWLNKEQAERGIDFTVINGDLFHNDPAFLPQAKACWDRLKMPYYVTHGNHDNTDAATWEKTWNQPLNHAFEKEGAAFLVLDTADEKGRYTCPDIDWTKQQLARYQTNEQLFIFMHITPINWTSAGHPCPELVNLFDQQTNLKAVFHGHDHDEDGAKLHNGKSYFFDSHIAGNWGTGYHGYRIVEVLKSGEILIYQMNPVESKRVNSTNV
jgi:predicted phosphodiesterase